MAKSTAIKKEKQPVAELPEEFQDRIENVLLSDTIESPTNPRSWFDEDYINNELAPSIQSVGVIEPIIVRILANGKKEVVVGACRTRASKVAGKTHIPAIIRNYTDDQAFEVQIIENLQRKNPHPQDEAYSFQKMLEVWHVGVKEVAARLGKSENYIAHRLKLNNLIPDIQRIFFQNKLHLGHALELCLLNEKDQAEFYSSTLAAGTKDLGTVTAFRKTLEQHFKRNLASASFDIHDATLVKEAGSCLNCMHNTGSNAILFPDQTRAICLNLSCFKKKTEVHFQSLIDKVENEKNHYLIQRYDNGDPTVKALKQDGHTIYKQYGEIDIEDPPTEPSLDDSEYEELNEEDLNKVFRADYETYVKEMEEYRQKLNSGKYPVGIMVSENGKGEKFLISFRKKGASPADQQLPEHVLMENELKDLREKLVRAKELVLEKTLEFARKEFEKDPLYSLIPEDRSLDLYPEERLALICYLYRNLDYDTRNALKKEFNIKNSGRAEFEALKLNGEKVAAWIIRRGLLNQTNIDINSIAGMSLLNVARSRMPQVSRNEEQLHDQRLKKAEKSKARINELEAKLKNPSSKNGLSDLLPDSSKQGLSELIQESTQQEFKAEVGKKKKKLAIQDSTN